jgi:hypothetical protein
MLHPDSLRPVACFPHRATGAILAASLSAQLSVTTFGTFLRGSSFRWTFLPFLLSIGGSGHLVEGTR